MGRRRKHNPLDLPPRVYAKHGAFYYHHRASAEHPSGRWEPLGTDVEAAKKRAAAITSDTGDGWGKTPYWLGEFIAAMRTRVKLKTLGQRTLDDYEEAVERLEVYFKDFYPAGIEPHHVAGYLDLGVELERSVRANREKACLSACFTWLIRKGLAGVKANPCKQVKRNTEFKRARYVEHEEMVEPLAIAPVQVWGLAHLIYRTLQRPEDIITWTPRNIIERRRADGQVVRVIRNDQGKTGAIVDIEVTPEIDAILARLKTGSSKKNVTGLTLLHRRDGKPYTYDGLCAMLRRRQEDVRDNHAIKRGPLAEMAPWGFYDMKGKGATDMWLSGIPLTDIQVLCGHESVTTTEKYVKARWRGVVAPNRVAVSV